MLLLLKSYVVLRALWKIDVYLIGTLVNKVFINILMPQWINNIGVFNFFFCLKPLKTSLVVKGQLFINKLVNMHIV